MEKRTLWILLGKHLSGEITAKERAILQKLIGEEQDMSYLIEFLEEQWKKKEMPGRQEDTALNEQWNVLREKIFPGKEKRSGKSRFSLSLTGRPFGLWYKIAACVMVLLATYYFMRVRTSRPSSHRHEIVVEKGTKKHVILPDGTGIWLNAGSTLSYNSGFGQENRDVWLEGEGFFKVVNDASMPFRVRTHDVTIKVLGTTFNVKAYDDEPDIQTTLISGKVQVLLNDDPEKKILLSPHEKLTVMSDKHTMVKTSFSRPKKAAARLPVIPRPNELKYQVQMLPLNPVDSTYFTETAWVNNQLAFVYQPFEEVAKKMERRYNVHIFFRDTSLKKVVMSGVFDKENIGQALQVLQLITRFEYHIEGDTIYLYK